MFKSAKKEYYQRTSVELGIDISDLKMTIFDLTNWINDKDK